MRINNEKPREKLLKIGASNLSNSELLAIIISTGTKKINVLTLAENILIENDLDYLNNIEFEELIKIQGIGKAKATTILAAIEFGLRVSNYQENNAKIQSPSDAFTQFGFLIKSSSREEFLVIYLNNKKNVIKTKILYKGTNKVAAISPKEIVSLAIRLNADGIIVMHNHPSSDLKPSQADIDVTFKIIETCKLCDVYFYDHLILSKNSYLSFKEKGYIN